MDLVDIVLAGKLSGTGGGAGGGANDYNDLSNKPQINGVELSGNSTLADLGIQPVTDESLSTTDKTIVGAINEIYRLIATISETLDSINGEEV